MNLKLKLYSAVIRHLMISCINHRIAPISYTGLNVRVNEAMEAFNPTRS